MQEELETIIREIQKDTSWRLRTRVVGKVEDNPNLLTAYIDGEWVPHIKLDPTYKEKIEKVGDAVQFQGNPFTSSVRAVLQHEYLHWWQCPKGRYLYENIFSGCATALQESNWGVLHESNTQVHKLISALQFSTNHFQDIVVNTFGASMSNFSADFREGISLPYILWNTEQTHPQTKALTISTDVQWRLWQQNPQYYQANAQGYHSDISDLQKVIENMLYDLTGNINLTKKAMDHTLSFTERKQIARTINSPANDNWHDRSYAFTKLLEPYLREDIDKLEEDQMPSQISVAIFGEPAEGDGDGEPGDESESNPKKAIHFSPAKEKPEKETDGSGEGDDEKEEKDTKEKRLSDTLRSGELSELLLIGVEKGRTIRYFDRFEYYDALYKQRANEIIIDYLDAASESDKFQIVPLQKEIMTPDNLDLRCVDWGSTRSMDSQITLFRGDDYLEIEDPLDSSPEGLYDLAFINDTSSSMRGDLEDGTGPFDKLLRANWAIFNWLERTGKGFHINYSVLNFSKYTRYKSWASYSELDSVKKEILHFQGGGTNLDSNKLTKMRETSRRPFASIMTTDGAINQWEKVGDSLIETTQLGNPTSVLYLPERKGFGSSTAKKFLNRIDPYVQTHVIENENDLIGIQLGHARNLWGNIS
jgi:hypothetical protein